MNLMTSTQCFVKKNAPTILAVTGAGCTVAAIITAITGTCKARQVIEEHKETITQIHIAKDDPNIPEEEYSEEDFKKDIYGAYLHTGLELAKVYAPTILLGTASVVCGLSSMNMMRKRNASLAAAAATISAGFASYRQRVTERFGEEVEDEIYNNYTREEVEEIVVDEKGKEKKVKKTVKKYANGRPEGLYSFVFDDSNVYWKIWSGSYGTDREHIYARLREIQTSFNRILEGRGKGGVVLLYEVLDALGIEKTAESYVVGWVNRGLFNGENPEGGDGYIDFGFDKDPQQVDHFLKGNNFIWLSFNVDGPVLDYIPSNAS